MPFLSTPRRSGSRRALLVLVALTAAGAACAGDVGKYRNAAIGTDVLAAGPQAGAGDAASGAAVGGASGADPAATPAGTDSSGSPAAATVPAAGGSASPGGAPVTAVSGPAARSSKPGSAANGSATPAASGHSSAAPGGAGPAGGASGGAPSGSASPAPSGAAGPAPTTPVPGKGGTATGVTKDTITVGVFYPKTGHYAGFGRHAPAVTQAAFDEAGLINGRRLVAKYYDDGTANASTIQVEAKRAKDEAFQLVSVVGESNVVLAPLANQQKLPLIMGNVDQKVALPLTYAFAVFSYWAHQAALLPGFIKNTLGGGSKKIGVVYEGTSTAKDAKLAFTAKAKELGLNVVFDQPIAQNQSTCANEVSNLQAKGVEVVFLLAGPLGGICMLRDGKALGYKPTWTGVGPSWGFNVVAQATGGGADGVRMLRTTPTLESAEGRHYADIMRRGAPNTGVEADDVYLMFYSMLRSMIEGLRRAGPDLTREGLVQTWETKMNGWDSGYLPPPTFGPGNRSGPLVVGVSTCCTNNRWTTIPQGWRADF